jgi:hypothetical protein
MKIDVWHNILWSRYKAAVFSEMHRLSEQYGAQCTFYQMAETDNDRMALSAVDHSSHDYPYNLLFRGSHSKIPKLALMGRAFLKVLASDADMVLLPGFSEGVHWVMLSAAVMSRKRRTVFCDSTLREHPQSYVKGMLKRSFFALCNGYFTYGERGQEYLVHYGANPERIFLRCQAAYLPQDYSALLALQARIAAHSEFHRSPPFLFVGRLSAEKGLDNLLQAFARVLVQSSTAQLRIVGDGPLKEPLRKLCAVLNMQERVTFVGGLGAQDLAYEYARALCLILPSRSEPWGLVANEALHYGCPVVVSENCGCVQELVSDVSYGLRFQVGDVNDLVAKMITATTAFADVKETAKCCLSAIASFTPERSARETLEGCCCVADRSRHAKTPHTR